MLTNKELLDIINILSNHNLENQKEIQALKTEIRKLQGHE